MSIHLLPDHWPDLQPGETLSARLTRPQLDRALREAKAKGYTLAVEPAAHYWLTLVQKEPK